MGREREIELKLEVDPNIAVSFDGMPGLADERRHRLLATYYDTPDGALREHGLSFRVRRDGDRFIQTIKLDRSKGAGLFDRSEWEMALPDDTPDLAAVDWAGLRGALDTSCDWNALRPAFTVGVERTLWQVRLDGVAAELVLDRGSVFADSRQETVSEIEIELGSGPPAALFDLARRVADRIPVRLGVLSKAERGYRLLHEGVGEASKANPIALPADISTADAFAMIVRACLRHFRLNEPLVARRDAAGLHQARVALRRLRSAISLFRKVVADERMDAIRTGLRRLAGTLGHARNLDVLLDRLGCAGDDAMLAKLQRERDAAYDRALAELGSKAGRLLVIETIEWAEVGAWRSSSGAAAKPLPARDFAVDVLDRFRRRVKKRGAHLADLDVDARHRARVEAKKLRYAAEFFTSLFDGKKARRRNKTFLSALEELQASLGVLNDIVTGEALARDLAGRGIRFPLPDQEDEACLLRDAEAAHDRLIDAQPFWR